MEAIQTHPPTRHVGLAMLGVLFGMLLAMLDNFIVGTALPSMVRELHGMEVMAWVVTAYALTTAITTPIWGKLGDLFGRKLMFQLSVAVFAVGSVLVALSPSMGLLIGARVVQGIGAGGLAVGAFAVIGALVPPRDRGKYQGLAAIVIALGTIGGPLLGGAITDALGWHWAFLINVPLAALVLIWVGVMLRLPHERRRARIDWLGAALLSAAISATVLETTWGGNTIAWLSVQSFGLIAVAIAAAAAFIWWQRRASEPIVPLEMFHERNFTLASALATVSGIVMFAAVLYLPLYQQTVQGASPTASGLLLLPMMVPIILASLFAGRRMSRTGRYRAFPIVGAISSVIGAGLLATMTAATPFWLTSIYMAFLGLGLGLSQQMTTTIAQNAVDLRHIGAASGIVTMLRTLGGAVGVAVFGGIYAAATGGVAGAALPVAATGATSVIFLTLALLSAIGVVLAWGIREIPLRTTNAAPAAAVAQR
ncbi:MAG: MFS transporter [Actinobacteria bacterium]|nr:MFS transporter [Actinomycetota bacterium]